MTLRNDFYKLINEYNNELVEARRNENFKRSFASLIRHDIAEKIQNHVGNTRYKAKGSVGAGRWTDVPWIAIFDKRITTSAQKGVYIVYLLNKDTKELFLTLNQGATDVAQGGDSTGKLAFTGIASASNSKAAESLKNRAKNIRSEIGSFLGLGSDPIDTGSKAYDAGCIYYIKYTLDSLPEDEKLYSDLNKFIEAYKAYYDKVFLTSEENVVQVEEGEGELQVGQQIEKVFEYINSKGFVYDEKLLKNFYLSLKSKPFVLLDRKSVV